MNIPELYLRELRTIFRVKIHQILWCGSKIRNLFWPWIRDGQNWFRYKLPGFATLPSCFTETTFEISSNYPHSYTAGLQVQSIYNRSRILNLKRNGFKYTWCWRKKHSQTEGRDWSYYSILKNYRILLIRGRTSCWLHLGVVFQKGTMLERINKYTAHKPLGYLCYSVTDSEGKNDPQKLFLYLIRPRPRDK